MSERLTDLFNLFIEKAISPAEKRELSELSLLDENQDQLHHLIRVSWNSDQAYEEMPADKSSEILYRILHATSPKRNPGIIWLKRLAAAAVLIGTILGGYEFFFKKPEKIYPNQPTASAIDIAPGTNRATLILGNGAAMILDSEEVGSLAHQGNTIITKTGNGSLAYTLDNQKATEIEYNTLRTPRGGQYKLILPDGTKVWLNAASSITYPTAFSGGQRLVKMTGEVYFEVVHNSKMPFVVLVGDQTVVDIGTEFNINAYTDEAVLSTTLVKGEVKVVAGNQTNLLLPGQQERVQNNIVRIDNQVDIARIIAWKQGLFVFNQTTLPVIMRQISRWYDVNIKYDGQVSHETFGGGISRSLPLSEVLKLLQSNGIQFRLEDQTLYVSQTQNQN